MQKPCVIFDDDENTYPYYHWFVKSICGFSGFKLSGKKIIKLPGYKELAYLHPNRFLPETAPTDDEKVVLLRFVSWTAFHDGGHRGFDLNHKRQLVKQLSQYARVYVSSEGSLPADLKPYKLSISPEAMHTFLSRIDLLVSESGTMTTEAAVLGIPVVRCNTYVGEGDLDHFIQMEKRYQLIYNFRDPEAAIEKALELIKTPGLKDIWKKKQQRLLTEKIDVTAFMIWLVEHYPDSFNAIKAAEPLEVGRRLPEDIPMKEWVLADG
jgi:predicted glycosyltransferase